MLSVTTQVQLLNPFCRMHHRPEQHQHVGDSNTSTNKIVAERACSHLGGMVTSQLFSQLQHHHNRHHCHFRCPRHRHQRPVCLGPGCQKCPGSVNASLLPLCSTLTACWGGGGGRSTSYTKAPSFSSCQQGKENMLQCVRMRCFLLVTCSFAHNLFVLVRCS